MKAAFAAFATKGNKVKQYLIVRVAEGLNEIANWIAMPGLYTFEAAQEMIDRATQADPDSTFMIQEVGTA